ncbi:MAG: hypothetical protein SGBAC_010814 [Bacillariaceae sp.]
MLSLWADVQEFEMKQKQWDNVREFVEEKPESVYSMNRSKLRLPIHELCQAAASMVDPSNDEEHSDDEEDEPPLPREQNFESLKSDNGQICELVRLLIDTSFRLGPAKVIPLEHGSDTDGSSSETDSSVEIHESILTVKDGDKKTPLHVLCENSADTQLMRVIFNGTREANSLDNAPSAQSLITATDRRGCTPLHYLAYSRECPISSLTLVMDYCEATPEIDPTICQDTDGDTPLHWALEGYMSSRRISLLLRHSTQALRMKNNSGYQPFDRFVANFVSYDWQDHDVVAREAWEVMQSYLKAAMGWREDVDTTWLPLHAVASTDFSLPTTVIEMALHFHQEDLSRSDPNGWLPLHRACARKTEEDADATSKLAVSLLKVYPQAAYRPTFDTKQLPLHIAIESSNSWELISALLAVYPSSLNMSNPPSGLWPFLVAGSQNFESVQTSYSLLRADPSILCVALRNVASKDGIRASKAMLGLKIGYSGL